MRTNDGKGNSGKMAKIDTFQFEAVDGKLVEDIAKEEEERLKGAPGAPTAEREYRFYTTNSVRRMDTQTVHRLSSTGTATSGIPTVPDGKRKPVTKKRAAVMLLPLCIIIAYIASVVAVDVLGLSGFYFRMTPVSVIMYILYIALSALGVLLLMFMDMLPKPLALLVVFVSLFCVHGNVYLMVPLILAFIAIGITVDGTYARIVVCAVAAFMAFYAVVLGVGNSKVMRSEPVVSEDGTYQLVVETTDDGSDLFCSLLLESRGTVYRKYKVHGGYVDIYYFGEDGTVAFGESNEYGQPKTVKTVRIEDIVN